MADEERGTELPHRVRGSARPGPHRPAPSVQPAMSEELRKRIRAAVEAERAGATAKGRERTTEQKPTAGPERTTELPRRGPRPKPASGQGTDAAANGVASGTNGKRNPTAAETAARPQPGPAREVTVKPPAAPPRTHRPPPRPYVPKKRRRRRARLATLVLTAIVIGSVGVLAVRHFTGSPSVSPAQLRQEAAARNQAAAWIAQQVSPTVTVSCDTVMCATLREHGFPSGKLVVLGPTSPDPVPSVLVVETAAVRDLFGSSLETAGAPSVLASFGSGIAATTIRIVAPHGAATYHEALSADLAARKTVGSALLNNSQITVSPIASSQLVAGLVDPRLLLALADLASRQPIDIVQCINPAPSDDPSIPLRFADLAVDVPAAHMGSAAYVQAVRTDLSSADPRVRPAKTVTAVVQGQVVLQIEFTAPSPLGWLSSQASH